MIGVPQHSHLTEAEQQAAPPPQQAAEGGAEPDGEGEAHDGDGDQGA
jgi:hypothetical protein